MSAILAVVFPALVASLPVSGLVVTPPAVPVLAANDKPLDEDRAKDAARKFVKEKKLDWGEPLRVEKHEKDLWVIFPTPEKEIQLLHWRTIIVAADGTARFLPRR